MAGTENIARFRVSYTFVDQTTGNQDAIRKEMRNLSFSSAFDPDDLNHWRVTRTTDGLFLLAAQRTIALDIRATSERDALRQYLYDVDVPADINVANIRIERLDEPATEPVSLAAAA